MDLLDKTLEEFIELFQGSTTYFGVSKPTGKKNSKGKTEFKHWVEPSPMSKGHWVQHLKGGAYYGSVPIRDDNTCSWGVIDVIVIIYSIKKLYRLYGKENTHSYHSDRNPTDSI